MNKLILFFSTCIFWQLCFATEIPSSSCSSGWQECSPIKLEIDEFKSNQPNGKTLILVHGSGGIGSSIEFQKHYLLSIGFNVVVPLSWASRNIRASHFDYGDAGKKGANQRSQTLDVYATIKYLENNGVSPLEIGVIGFSGGSIVGHWADSQEFRKQVADKFLGYSKNPKFVIGMYGCSGEFNRKSTSSQLPFEIIMGDQDDLYPSCVLYTQLKAKVNSHVQLHTLNRVYHDFDASYLAKDWPNQNTEKCFAIIEVDGNYSMPLMPDIRAGEAPKSFIDRLKICATTGEHAGNNGDQSIGQATLVDAINKLMK
jgi:dienelactone hydrolase